MHINKVIIQLLEQHNIDVDEGTLYLLGVYFGIKTKDVIPETTMKQVNFCNIVVRDYDKTPVEIKWNIPLFEGLNETTNTQDTVWGWVIADYRKKFMDIRGTAGGDKTGCISKMKRFFAEHPDVRQEEVLQAVELYIETEGFRYDTSKVKFLQQADYFISKVVKAEGTSYSNSRLEQYIELIRLQKQEEIKPSDQRFMGGLIS